MSLTRAENLRSPTEGNRADGNPGSGPADPFGSKVSAVLPLLLMTLAAIVRLAHGLVVGEPMNGTIVFLSALLGLCILGLVSQLVTRVKPTRRR